MINYENPPRVTAGAIHVDDASLSYDDLDWKDVTAEGIVWDDGRVPTLVGAGYIGERHVSALLGYSPDKTPFLQLDVSAPFAKEIRCTFDFAEVQA